ncbi:tyrosine-type recombinase/integrase [Altererythrobacter sp. BO-6]|uniref:tyrosine-type recombinase/integrase n=1 Tax=Altererythrobacter sp. BO-6 TaxID=2604537 RepID=UPI0013E15CE9|nr:tyrosine-type recombinase/integrase [Altererythrobacter sp. BO-6]QIG54274.1 tyrosine-type recombinase/integrase [Altererythrobacter sp. BO-6]
MIFYHIGHMDAQRIGLDWRSEFQRLEGAYAPSTMRSYRADVEAFEDWCVENCIRQPFPASVETVCRFLEDQGQSRASSTVQRRLYAIRKVHRLLRLPDPTYDEDINLAMRKVRRARSIRPRQAKGLTRNYLDSFLESEPDTPWGLRNRAMLALGYELLTRRSELIALRNRDIVERADGTLRVLIRRSKADPYGQGRIAFTSKRTADLLGEWLSYRGPEIEWLFCPIYQGKVIDRCLETTTVRRVIKEAAQRCGLRAEQVASFSGHSMRVGAAQDLLRRGFDTAAIMRAGGWKSVNVLARYLEKAEHNVWA